MEIIDAEPFQLAGIVSGLFEIVPRPPLTDGWQRPHQRKARIGPDHVEVLGCKSDAKKKARAAFFSDSVHDVLEQREAFADRPAILVGSPVGERVQELMNEISLG